LQGECVARTTHCDSGYDLTIATYSLPDLYLPKMKNVLFVAPWSNRLSWGCAVSCAYICSHPLMEQQEQMTLLEGWRLWFYFLNGEKASSPLCHHGNVKVDILELCDECNDCTKFHFFTEKVLRDIPYFAIYIGVHTVMSQFLWFAWVGILNGSSTGSAFAVKWMPFFIVLKTLSNKLIKNFVSYTL